MNRPVGIDSRAKRNRLVLVRAELDPSHRAHLEYANLAPSSRVTECGKRLARLNSGKQVAHLGPGPSAWKRRAGSTFTTEFEEELVGSCVSRILRDEAAGDRNREDSLLHTHEELAGGAKSGFAGPDHGNRFLDRSDDSLLFRRWRYWQSECSYVPQSYSRAPNSFNRLADPASRNRRVQGPR